MSKHWQPGVKVVPFRAPQRARRTWHGMDHVSNGGRRGRRHHRQSADLPFWRLTALLSAFVGLSVWYYLPSSTDGSSSSGTAIISFGRCHTGGGRNCVVDGDTFYIDGEKIRIAGIDTAETHPPRCAEEARLGFAAADRLRVLLNSGAVTLSSIDRDEDVYGRKLRNVAVDGRDVGETLISEGLARPYAGGRRSWCG